MVDLRSKIKKLQKTVIFVTVLTMVLTQAVLVFAGFVRRQGTQFYLDGNTFYFAGANCYDVFTFGDGANYTNPQDIENKFMDKARIDAHMVAMQRNGVKLLRVWGFSHESWHGFEPTEGVYNESEFMLFDYIMQSAESHGIKLIIVLENYWEAYGGIDKRLQWEGLPNGSHAARTQFYTNAGCKQQYKNYVAHFVTRLNHYDGTRYIDDPTIFSWELMNEPRYQDGGENTTGTTLRAWVDEMAAYIKSLDPNHMVSAGLEGHGLAYNFGGDEGNPFVYIHQSPYIDFTTAHPYPTEDWANLTLEQTRSLISQWISDSHNIVGKPFVMEEHNVHESRVNRSVWWQGMYDELYNDRGDGDCFWWFEDHQVDGTFGVMDGDPELTVFKSQSDRMAALNGPLNGAPGTPSQPAGPATGDIAVSYSYSTSSTDPEGDNIQYTFDWNDGTTTTTGYYSSGATASATHSWNTAKSYYVKVKAKDTKGAESSWSNSLMVMIGGGDVTPPAPPTNVSVVNADLGGQLDISWANPTDTDFSHIHIYRSTVSGNLGNLVYDNITGTSQSDTGLTNGTAYYYTLRSVDTSGNESTNTDQYSGIPTGVPYLYDFETGTQSWVNDTSVYFANNLTTPSSSNIYAQKGTRSLAYSLDLGVRYTNGEINDAGFVDPSPAKDLLSYKGVRLYVLIPSGVNIPTDKPATCTVYVKTSSSWNWFESNAPVALTLGTWNEVTIDFTAARNGSGQTNQSVTSLTDVREIGVHLTGGSTSSGTTVFYVDSVKPMTETVVNNPPNVPSVPSGPTSLTVTTSYTYSTVATDPENDTISYTFDWGDGTTTNTAYLNSGVTGSASHSWSAPGTYNIKTKATDSKGAASNWGTALAVTVQGDTTPPTPPTNVQVTNPQTSGTLNLSWTNPTDSDFNHIHIYRSTTAGGLGALVYDNVTGTTKQDTGLTNGVRYYYTLRSVDTSANESTNTTQYSEIPTADITPPAPPTNVQVSDPQTGGQLNLSWTNPTDSDFNHIHIYRSTTSLILGNLTYDNVTGTTKQDTGLTNNTVYYYTLRSVDTSGNESTNTTQYSGTPSIAVNRALNKTAYASSNDGYAGPPSGVCDGNMSTRWASAYSDPQWIYIDLGAQYNINKVILRWEAAYGKTYQIQISNDTANWTSIYSTTNGDGGVDEIIFATTSVRYVRMYGTQRGTGWGYSLWEFEVYGPSTGDTTPPAPPTNIQVTDPQTGGQLNLSWTNPTDSDFNHIHIYRSTTAGVLGSLAYDNVTGITKQDTGLTNNTIYYYTLRSVDTSGNESTNTTQYSGKPTVPTNLARSKNAYASSNDGYAGSPSSVCDGNMSTRWASSWGNNQWIYIDLGANYDFNRVVLYWEVAYGQSYRIETSNNASNWTTVFSTTSGDGGKDEVSFTLRNARYVRMYGVKKATKWGFSLWEFEVYNLSAPQSSVDTLVNEAEINLAAKGRPDNKIITPNNDGVNDSVAFGGSSVKIYDVTGRLVRSLNGTAIWNGRDDDNDVVRNGVYIYQYDYNGEAVSGTIAVAR